MCSKTYNMLQIHIYLMWQRFWLASAAVACFDCGRHTSKTSVDTEQGSALKYHLSLGAQSEEIRSSVKFR